MSRIFKKIINFFPSLNNIGSYEIFMRAVHTRVGVQKLSILPLVFQGIEIIKWKRRKINTRLSIQLGLVPLDSSSSRQPFSDTSKLNIFDRNSLEASPITSTDKNYNLVGLTELQEFIRRSKKTHPKKHTRLSALNLSLKSYTAKSNEPEDTLLTKDEVLATLKQNSQTSPCQSTNFNKKNDNPLSKYTQSTIGKKAKKFRIKDNRFSDKLDKYQEKVEVLKKYTLHQKKQNIATDQWKNILRSQIGLSEVFDKNEKYFEIVKRNGFKVVASSKKKKELQWMESQKESTLYEFIEMQKNVQAANLKLKKKEELIVIRN